MCCAPSTRKRVWIMSSVTWIPRKPQTLPCTHTCTTLRHHTHHTFPIYPSVIVKFLLGWFTTRRQERDIGGAELSHTMWENEEENGDGDEGERGGGSLVPDLWIIVHITKFISDSERTDVALVNGHFVVVETTEPIRGFVGRTNAGVVMTQLCQIQTY